MSYAVFILRRAQKELAQLEEAIANIREAIELYPWSLKEDGLPIRTKS